MSVVDKAINKAFRWENKEIGPREMIYLVQSELISRCTEKELRKLLKGLSKNWVLAIGHGASLRILSCRDSQWAILMDYSIITHGLREIILRDYENKVAYYISSEKATTKKLQRLLVACVSKHLELYEQREEAPNFQSKEDYFEAPVGGVPKENPFTPNAVSRDHRNVSHKSGKNSKNDASSLSNIIITVIIVTLAAAFFLGIGSSLLQILKMPMPFSNRNLNKGSQPAWVSTVKQGYLGEFTDMTVSDLLWSCRDFYEIETWDGGTTKDGKRIAEARFHNPNSGDSATIQFEMPNDDVFKLSAFKDSHMEISASTDILFFLNSSYYSGRCLDCLDDSEAQEKLDSLMMRVSGSEVLYGASRNYSGDRSQLHLLFNEDRLELSAAELMEAYGITLLRADHSDALPIITETVPASYTYEWYSADELLQTIDKNVSTASNRFLGKALKLSGEFHFVQGETEYFIVDSPNGWFNHYIICKIADDKTYRELLGINELDIIQLNCVVTSVNDEDGYTVTVHSIEDVYTPTDNSIHSSGPAATEPLTLPNPIQDPIIGTVAWSAGEINLRSGPGTSYASVQRLSAGCPVTIYEQQFSDGRNWGRTDGGWVCMDYITIGQIPTVTNSAKTTLVYSVEGQRQEKAATVQHNNGYRITIPDEGWFFLHQYNVDTWQNANLLEAKLYVYPPNGMTRDEAIKIFVQNNRQYDFQNLTEVYTGGARTIAYAYANGMSCNFRCTPSGWIIARECTIEALEGLGQLMGVMNDSFCEE